MIQGSMSKLMHAFHTNSAEWLKDILKLLASVTSAGRHVTHLRPRRTMGKGRQGLNEI